MSKLNELTVWDLPDTLQVPDGYDMKTIPDVTRDNFARLLEEHNKAVRVLNILIDRFDIVLGEEDI